jgi:hypothetical protein
VDQISDSSTRARESAATEEPAAEQDAPAGANGARDAPGFRSRGSARRRARFLRRARELAYRDLGGLVFNLHRFGARNDALVLAKLTTLEHIDTELRALEDALREHKPITVLREAGITACPRCAAIHSSEDGFCPSCGLALGRHVDLPVGASPAMPGSPPFGAGAAPAPVATTPTPAAVSTAPVPAPSPPQEPAPPTTGGDEKDVAAENEPPAAENEPTEILRPSGSGE